MKRHRILKFDFNSTVATLKPAQDTWDEKVKEQHERNRAQAIEHVSMRFGEVGLDLKVQNFIDLDYKPISIMGFHNKFLEQCRNSFVIGSYYPSLTSACALGERILNHLIIGLRDNYRSTQEYRKVYNKRSFDNWPLVIDTLESWSVLTPEAAEKFRQLNDKRNRAIHFNPETDHNDRDLALEAIHLLQEIVSLQFSAFGHLPWLFIVPGECYIRKEWAGNPFVKLVYLSNCALVGPKHKIEGIYPQIIINDNFEYDQQEITDEEFIRLRSLMR
ncbi:MAG: hypothetical protein ACXV8I_05480 [Methylobacter sp.]